MEYLKFMKAVLRLTENWKKPRDDKISVNTSLMDLSNVFDSIPHDLLVGKLHPYGLSEDAVTFVHSYLKHSKQDVKTNDTESVFQIFLSGLPQGSILSPMLFNILIDDFVFFIKDV